MMHRSRIARAEQWLREGLKLGARKRRVVKKSESAKLIKDDDDRFVYLDHRSMAAPGWYWIERREREHRITYTGPFKTRDAAFHDMETHWESSPLDKLMKRGG